MQLGIKPVEESRVLLFSGHMIDLPNRTTPRFPAAMEPVAKHHIREAVLREWRSSQGATGIAGGACGGDILFHEACGELGIASEIFLAFPPDEFIERSLAPAGDGWVERFVRLADRLPIRVLPGSTLLHSVTPDSPAQGAAWEQCNRWMLDTAFQRAVGQVTLIVLWDGGPAENPGGTCDMVDEAQEQGARTVILDPRRLFGPGTQ